MRGALPIQASTGGLAEHRRFLTPRKTIKDRLRIGSRSANQHLPPALNRATRRAIAVSLLASVSTTLTNPTQPH